VPEDLRVDDPVADDLHPQRVALRVYFSLPRGSYATLVIRGAEACMRVAHAADVELTSA
jgi:tRNA(Glu) U13 pseudouridine synthase TruD